MKRAVRAAFMYAPTKAAREELKELEASLQSEGKTVVYKECEREVARRRIPQDAKIMVLQGVARRLCRRKPVQQSGQTLAARQRGTESAEKLFVEERDAVRKDFGKDAVPEES
jgi:hypothetical protein